jgi:hypothetical protein
MTGKREDEEQMKDDNSQLQKRRNYGNKEWKHWSEGLKEREQQQFNI